jgi:hypothetical protein
MRVSRLYVAFSHLGLLPLMAWTMRAGASTGLPSGGASTGLLSGGASTGLLSGGAWRVSQRVDPPNALLCARTVVGVVVGGSVEVVVTGVVGRRTSGNVMRSGSRGGSFTRSGAGNGISSNGGRSSGGCNGRMSLASSSSSDDSVGSV